MFMLICTLLDGTERMQQYGSEASVTAYATYYAPRKKWHEGWGDVVSWRVEARV